MRSNCLKPAGIMQWARRGGLRLRSFARENVEGVSARKGTEKIATLRSLAPPIKPYPKLV